MRSRYFQTRDSFIPESAVALVHEHSSAVAYTYTDSRGRLYAVAFGSRRNKPDWHFSFRTEEARARKITEHFAQCQAREQAKVERRAQGPSEIAQRNAAIKRLLEAHYGKGKVRVTGERGTAYGWVDVRIATPCPEGQRPSEAHSDIVRMILDAGIKLYSYDSADYGSGYKISVSFTQPRQSGPSTEIFR
ncbi:MAG TPA: hypothetical protein VJ770_09950 [Stellaceae bacterium]|nr:hypothetical protein [Stellaceae bacterium]